VVHLRGGVDSPSTTSAGKLITLKCASLTYTTLLWTAYVGLNPWHEHLVTDLPLVVTGLNPVDRLWHVHYDYVEVFHHDSSHHEHDPSLND